MSSELVKSFNELPRKRMAPSGKVPNIWYFDMRYVHLEPTPSHVVYFFQPHSDFVHIERLPINLPSGRSGIEFFPESAKEAAPEVAMAILRAFVNSITDPAKMHATAAPAFAPWNLITEAKDLAVGVGKELKRLGIRYDEVWKIGISTTTVNAKAHATFITFFKTLKESIGFSGISSALISTPETILFHNFKGGQRCLGPDYGEEGQEILKYAQLLSNARPHMGLDDSSQSFKAKMMHDIQLTEKLLNSKPTCMVKVEADNGNPQSAMDYGLRLLLGIGCNINRKLARDYLIKVISSDRALNGVKSTAHSILIDWYISSSKNEIRSRYLYAAAHHANQAVVLGRSVSPQGASASPAVLWFMSRILDSLSKKVPDLNMFFKDAWQAMEDRNKELSEGQAKMRAKRMEKPNRYRCAAVGCGVESDCGQMLSRCSGKCDHDKKPSYCSKECQKADWKNHKPFCKAGAECSVIDSKGQGDSHFGMNGPASKRGTIQIPIPTPDGTTMYVSSSTVDPKTLREARDYAASGHYPSLPTSFTVEKLERVL